MGDTSIQPAAGGSLGTAASGSSLGSAGSSGKGALKPSNSGGGSADRPQYKLCYFPFRGRGEFIRYILHYLEIPFVDNRVTFEQWAQVKPRTPFGALPVLHVDDRRITQSFAIARYLARQYGLTGASSWDAAQVDMYADGISDVMSAFRPVCIAVVGQKYSDVPGLFATYRQKTVQPFLDRYEGFLEKNGTGWLVGNQITWADLLAAELLERFESCFDDQILSAHPRMRALVKRVHELPAIARYLETRPKMPF
jgi:glutathione S-transferase